MGRAQKGTLPLSLSYDHRVVDGADAARFIAELVRALEHFAESELRGQTPLSPDGDRGV